MSAPFLVVCRTADEVSYHVLVEEESTCEVSTFNNALIHLIGSYFVYDISYPKPLYSLLVMIQHYIFGLEDSQKDSPSVVEVVTSLKNMETITV